MTRYRPSHFRVGDRDANEREICAVLDRYGVRYVRQGPGAGFDLLVFTNPMECWEVKNSARRWSLTETEMRLASHCRERGIPYRIIETPQQAADAIAEARTEAK